MALHGMTRSGMGDAIDFGGWHMAMYVHILNNGQSATRKTVTTHDVLTHGRLASAHLLHPAWHAEAACSVACHTPGAPSHHVLPTGPARRHGPAPMTHREKPRLNPADRGARREKGRP